MKDLKPAEIISELDKYIIGQDASGNYSGWNWVDNATHSIRTRKLLRNAGSRDFIGRDLEVGDNQVNRVLRHQYYPIYQIGTPFVRGPRL